MNILQKIIFVFLVINLIICNSINPQTIENIPAFPQAEGFGAFSKGGRGGKVIYVENLNDNGPGSFRAAILDTEPRVIVFRVSGTIDLLTPLYLTSPYVTIAGQTSPGDGICLRNYPLQIRDTHDVIVRNIRVRPGIGSGQAIDGIEIRRSQRVILNHCSASWAVDEILNTTHGNKDITIQWGIFSEALNNSIHEKGEHGYGASIGAERSTYHHNLFVNNAGRNPSISGDDSNITNQLDFRSNVVFSWKNRACDGKPRTINFAGNYYELLNNNTSLYVCNILIMNILLIFTYITHVINN